MPRRGAPTKGAKDVIRRPPYFILSCALEMPFGRETTKWTQTARRGPLLPKLRLEPYDTFPIPQEKRSESLQNEILAASVGAVPRCFAEQAARAGRASTSAQRRLRRDEPIALNAHSANAEGAGTDANRRLSTVGYTSPTPPGAGCVEIVRPVMNDPVE